MATVVSFESDTPNQILSFSQHKIRPFGWVKRDAPARPNEYLKKKKKKNKWYLSFNIQDALKSWDQWNTILRGEEHAELKWDRKFSFTNETVEWLESDLIGQWRGTVHRYQLNQLQKYSHSLAAGLGKKKKYKPNFIEGLEVIGFTLECIIRIGAESNLFVFWVEWGSQMRRGSQNEKLRLFFSAHQVC